MKRVCLPFLSLSPQSPPLRPAAPSETAGAMREATLRVWCGRFTKKTTIRGHISLITTKSSQAHVPVAR